MRRVVTKGARGLDAGILAATHVDSGPREHVKHTRLEVLLLFDFSFCILVLRGNLRRRLLVLLLFVLVVDHATDLTLAAEDAHPLSHVFRLMERLREDHALVREVRLEGASRVVSAEASQTVSHVTVDDAGAAQDYQSADRTRHSDVDVVLVFPAYGEDATELFVTNALNLHTLLLTVVLLRQFGILGLQPLEILSVAQLLGHHGSFEAGLLVQLGCLLTVFPAGFETLLFVEVEAFRRRALVCINVDEVLDLFGFGLLIDQLLVYLDLNRVH